MNTYSKADVPNVRHKHGESIYELLSSEKGGSIIHSVAIATIETGKSSLNHYHPVAEESYYILKGKAKVIIDTKQSFLNEGQIVLIKPTSEHKIFNIGASLLEFLVICVPAWEPSNTVFLEECAADGQVVPIPSDRRGPK